MPPVKRPGGATSACQPLMIVARKLSGHLTESVYRRYAIADSAALEEGVGKLASLHQNDRKPRTVVPIEEAREA